MESKYAMTILDKKTGKLVTYDQRTGEMVAQEGTQASRFQYSVEIGDAIANMITEGHTLKEIAALSGMPELYLIYNWKRYHPDFSDKLDRAKKDRATWFHDEAVQVLKDSGTLDKEEVAREKFRFDGFMKLAERNAPDEFGQKSPAAGFQGATTIVINTGIARKEVIQVEGNNHEQIPNEEFSEDGRRTLDRDGSVSVGDYVPEADIRIGAEIGDLDGATGAEDREGGIEEEGIEEEGIEEE